MKQLPLVLLGFGLLCSCTGGGITSAGPSLITVTLAPTGATGVDQGQTVSFSATLTSDTSSQGVTWSVSGTGCTGSACGTFTNVTSTSATYNAPSPITSSLTVTVTATSVANTGKSASSAVNVNPAPTISTTSLAAGSVGDSYLATLAASGGTGTLTWNLASGSLPAGLTITNGGVVPGTGLSAAATISGTPKSAGRSTFTLMVTDSAPTPLSATSPSLGITIYNVWSQTCSSSGNEAVLSGQYAFTLSGFSGSGYQAVAGAFEADGTGKITAGEADTNGALGAQTANIMASASGYAVGPDNRGCATLATPFGTYNARFALGTVANGVATEGRVVEWETGSSAYIGAGHILQQAAASISGGPSGNYVYGLTGWDPAVEGPMAVAGVLTASGGSFSDVDQDTNDAGTPANSSALNGSYSSFDSFGRGTASFYNAGSLASTATLYMVSGSKLFFLETSPAYLIGEWDQQIVPSGGFTNNSLNATAVYYSNAADKDGTGADAHFGLLTGNGTGSATVADYDDDDGMTLPVDNYSCIYSVAPNGRTSITGGTGPCAVHPPVFYLTTANTGYLVGTGKNTDAGAFEPQVGSSFSTSSLSGAYYFGPAGVVSQAVVTTVGVLTLDGSGGMNYTLDLTSINGQGLDETPAGTIAVNSDGTFSVSGAGGAVSGVVISPSKFMLNEYPTAEYPTLSVVKQ